MLKLSNAAARRLFLAKHGFADSGDDLLAAIEKLGFVQIDSIATVERAHHMILAGRRKTYRPPHLATLLERRRDLFEHWTHDASVIPVRFYPYWRHRFDRDRERLTARWRKFRRPGFEEQAADVLEHIRANGPALSRDLGDDSDGARPQGSAGWWDWKPSKTALEYLWRTGELAVSGRQGFQKAFDLTERVIPADILAKQPSAAETIEWACASALDRLGFATTGQIANFWETASPAEAKEWAAAHLGEDVVEIVVEGAAGDERRMLARPDIAEAIANVPEPGGGIRVLSPFDPMLRDRKRAEWLFGFSYRIEIYVPAAKRQYGYYVFPLLEGARLIGRIDMKRMGQGGPLVVRAVWPEAGVSFGKGRIERLEREIARVARYAGADGVSFEPGWLR